MIMIITEEERQDILSKYQNNTSDELLNYLKRHFPTGETNFEFMTRPQRFVVVDDKLRFVDGNKKYLVGKIDSIIEDVWLHLPVEIRRRTIKKFIDGISL